MPKDFDIATIDTNIIQKDNFSLDTANFTRFFEACDELGIRIAITLVALVEAAANQEERIDEEITTARNRLEKHDGMGLVEVMPAYKEVDLFKHFLSEFARQIDANQLELIPTPKTLDTNQYLRHAAQHVAPFQKNDKGFRDYLLIHSVMNYMEDVALQSLLLVTGDKIFSDPAVRRAFAKKQLDLQVFENLHDATKHLEAILDAKNAEAYEQFANRFLQYLKDRIAEVDNFVKKKGTILSSTIKGIGLYGTERKLPTGSTIERIHSIHVQDIVGVHIRDIVGSEQNEKVQVYVNLSLKVSVRVRTPQFDVFQILGDLIPLAEYSSYSEKSTFKPRPDSIEDLEVDVDYSIIAEFILRDDQIESVEYHVLDEIYATEVEHYREGPDGKAAESVRNLATE